MTRLDGVPELWEREGALERGPRGAGDGREARPDSAGPLVREKRKQDGLLRVGVEPVGRGRSEWDRRERLG